MCELAKILGRPLYSFTCSSPMSRYTLIDIFRGLASSGKFGSVVHVLSKESSIKANANYYQGCVEKRSDLSYLISGAWVCLNSISAIQPPVLSVLTQLVTVVLDGLRANKTTVILQDDEVTLSPHGACFGTIHNLIHQHDTKYDPSVGFFPSFKSPASFLPVELLDMFRPVALVGPDLQVILQVWLLSQGFTQVSSLASKIVTLRELCQKLLPSSSKPLSKDLCLCLHICTGWGAYCLKRMIDDAGSHLCTSSDEYEAAVSVKGPSLDGERIESPTDVAAIVNAPLESLREEGK